MKNETQEDTMPSNYTSGYMDALNSIHYWAIEQGESMERIAARLSAGPKDTDDYARGRADAVRDTVAAEDRL